MAELTAAQKAEAVALAKKEGISLDDAKAIIAGQGTATEPESAKGWMETVNLGWLYDWLPEYVQQQLDENATKGNEEVKSAVWGFITTFLFPRSTAVHDVFAAQLTTTALASDAPITVAIKDRVWSDPVSVTIPSIKPFLDSLNVEQLGLDNPNGTPPITPIRNVVTAGISSALSDNFDGNIFTAMDLNDFSKNPKLSRTLYLAEGIYKNVHDNVLAELKKTIPAGADNTRTSAAERAAEQIASAVSGLKIGAGGKPDMTQTTAPEHLAGYPKQIYAALERIGYAGKLSDIISLNAWGETIYPDKSSAAHLATDVAITAPTEGNYTPTLVAFAQAQGIDLAAARAREANAMKVVEAIGAGSLTQAEKDTLAALYIHGQLTDPELTKIGADDVGVWKNLAFQVQEKVTAGNLAGTTLPDVLVSENTMRVNGNDHSFPFTPVSDDGKEFVLPSATPAPAPAAPLAPAAGAPGV